MLTPGFKWLNASFYPCSCRNLKVVHPTVQTKALVKFDATNMAQLSEVSWGETSGLYPSKDNKYSPDKWVGEKLKELLKCRAAVHLVASRGEKHKKNKPKSTDKIETMLATYHLVPNFPEVDAEIKNNNNVKFFYLDANKDIAHPSIDSAHWNQKIVKAYGPFYNIGGGDVAVGDTYVIFYEATKKK